jgi:hypothetical protein
LQKSVFGFAHLVRDAKPNKAAGGFMILPFPALPDKGRKGA